MFRNEAEIRHFVDGVFDRYNVDHAAEGLSRWQFHFAWTSLLGEPPLRVDMMRCFDENALEESRFDNEMQCRGSQHRQRVSRENFVELLVPLVRDKYFTNASWTILDAVDEKGKGYCTVRDCQRARDLALSIFSQESELRCLSESRLTLLFEMSDLDHDGRLLEDDVRTIISRAA